MSSINVGRVVAAGMLAGLVVNISETILNLVVVAQPDCAQPSERPLGEWVAVAVGSRRMANIVLVIAFRTGDA